MPAIVVDEQDDEERLTGLETTSAPICSVTCVIWRTHSLTADCYHLRTLDGREVDLLIELENGYVGIEIKSSCRVGQSDARHLQNLAEILDKPLLHALVVSNDDWVHEWEGVTAVPATWLLG